jgi:UDP-N-acetylmuramoyl-L-alanyl-D-glutamate--2,6-diaminopimelate ligase
MEAYFEAKARLFTELSPEVAVVNVDDPYGAELARRVAAPTRLSRVSRAGAAEADLRVTGFTADRAGLRATLEAGGRRVELATPMLGAHNLENLLLAAGCLTALGHPLEDAAEALGRAGGAPGRLERVEGLEDVMVLVDYAHTPDALERALAALRPVTPGRLFVVFGCGGDRDRGKRPKMGEAAGRGADLAVVTSDNPRTEDPFAILAAIEPGVAAHLPKVASVAGVDRGYAVTEDRREAIRAALEAARPGDTVLIAGKGHEDYQIRGTTRLHFDDREEARYAMAAKSGEG